MEKSVEFAKGYFGNIVDAYEAWEADEDDLQSFFDGDDWMDFEILFANDNCVILDAGKRRIYIEWGANECPVYADLLISTAYNRRPTTTSYTRIGRVRNSRFWALAERWKHHLR